MKRKALEVIPRNERLDRAKFCTEYLENFEGSCRNWVDLATVLLEVERDELFLEVGFASWDDWAHTKAPVSHRLCYAIKGRYKALREAGLSDAELKLMPKETAQWAAKAKNISPAELAKPEVKEMLRLPKQKAVKALKDALPNQHIEIEESVTCKFAGSQHRVIFEAYEVFKKHKDEHGSFEEFVEFCVSEWILSFAEAVK